jgi:lipoate-protein ligase A
MGTRSSMKNPPSSLHKMVQKQFTPENKAKRISRALAALNEEERITLSPEQWKSVAEDVDLEQQA